MTPAFDRDSRLVGANLTEIVSSGYAAAPRLVPDPWSPDRVYDPRCIWGWVCEVHFSLRGDREREQKLAHAITVTREAIGRCAREVDAALNTMSEYLDKARDDLEVAKRGPDKAAVKTINVWMCRTWSVFHQFRGDTETITPSRFPGVTQNQLTRLDRFQHIIHSHGTVLRWLPIPALLRLAEGELKLNAQNQQALNEWILDLEIRKDFCKCNELDRALRALLEHHYPEDSIQQTNQKLTRIEMHLEKDCLLVKRRDPDSMHLISQIRSGTLVEIGSTIYQTEGAITIPPLSRFATYAIQGDPARMIFVGRALTQIRLLYAKLERKFKEIPTAQIENMTPDTSYACLERLYSLEDYRKKERYLRDSLPIERREEVVARSNHQTAWFINYLVRYCSQDIYFGPEDIYFNVFGEPKLRLEANFRERAGRINYLAVESILLVTSRGDCKRLTKIMTQAKIIGNPYQLFFTDVIQNAIERRGTLEVTAYIKSLALTLRITDIEILERGLKLYDCVLTLKEKILTKTNPGIDVRGILVRVKEPLKARLEQWQYLSALCEEQQFEWRERLVTEIAGAISPKKPVSRMASPARSPAAARTPALAQSPTRISSSSASATPGPAAKPKTPSSTPRGSPSKALEISPSKAVGTLSTPGRALPSTPTHPIPRK